jgi:deoxyribodipyrimidine photo-lyase
LLPNNVALIRSNIDRDTTVFWFRRDLRITDNAGLYHALKDHTNVLPLFIFDTTILDTLEDSDDRRVEFIHHSLRLLKSELEEHGSSLLIFHGNPADLFKTIDAKAVYTNHDHEPYARARDQEVAETLAKRNITFKSFKDQVIFERSEVMKDNGEPYTVFTPYSKKWKSLLTPFQLKKYPTEKYSPRLKQLSPLPFPQLADIGFKETGTAFPERMVKTKIISSYDKTRDFPFRRGTTRLSVHLRFGTISIRQLAGIAMKKNGSWLNELIWREFYQMILWHFPRVEQAFKPAYDRILWRNNMREFEAWCKGRTGYPIVDAGMRELNATGFMHNRVRMITASFLVKHLLIDWRWGEAYFAKNLLDFELASNNGGWQWAAGSGCDAAPYFRIFNPKLQQQKFDPELKYVKLWVPEYGTPAYPAPIVEHTLARERALSVYKRAVGA